jgi:hypothetical protein
MKAALPEGAAGHLARGPQDLSQTLQKPLICRSNTPVLPTVFEEKRSNNDK